MTKKDVINKIKELANGNEYSNIFIQRCLDIVDQMDIVPTVRKVVDDLENGVEYGIAFDCNKNNFSVEITVFNDEIWGYVDYNENPFSSFVFESDESAINFWNIVLGKEF